MRTKTCLECRYYLMSGEEERGRTSLDFCTEKGQYLPVAAFSFNDVCCGNMCCFATGPFLCLEEIAEACNHYEKRRYRTVQGASTLRVNVNPVSQEKERKWQE